jgi:hypothetical protein
VESLIPFSRLLNVQAHPAAGRARHVFSQISDFNFFFAQNYMLGVIACQTQVLWRRRHKKPALFATRSQLIFYGCLV